MAGQFVNIDGLHIDLIDSINPFQKAFEILSKSVTSHVLKIIQETIEATRIQMTEEEALLLWPKVKTFFRVHGKEPLLNALDPLERRPSRCAYFHQSAASNAGLVMNKETLLALIADDDLGLLKVKPKGASASSSEDRLVASFGEINDFVRKHDRVPSPNQIDVHEYRLYSRLQSLRQDRAKATALSEYDEFGLVSDIKEIKSIADVYGDDEFGILSDASASIFELKHVSKQTTMPDYVASRKPCKDFERFEPLLVQCQADLAIGKRRLLPFAKEQQIHVGLFFVLKGILLYVSEVGDRETTGGKNNARLRCVFENGTESDMLLRSLAAELYKDGRRVSVHDEAMLDGFNDISADDQESGFIYVLRSRSERPEFKRMADLYKIGFCRGSVEDRIKNAEQDPTFLMARVSVIVAYKCFNMNAVKLEQLLHRFFGEWCLDVDVTDAAGQKHVPREWFVAPFEVIEQAIELIRNGDIVHFRYDGNRKRIIGRDPVVRADD